MNFICSDERIQVEGLANPGSVLFDLIVLGKDAATLAEMYRAAGVTTIYSHEECGAAKAALGKADATWDDVNEFAIGKTRAFCDEFGFKYGHITAAELVPHGHVHPGTAIRVSNDTTPAGVYRVSPVVAVDPSASVNALLTLVAFKPGNGGDICKTTGTKFQVLVADLALLPMTIDSAVAAFVEVTEMR